MENELDFNLRILHAKNYFSNEKNRVQNHLQAGQAIEMPTQ